jgi:hypothetical protein
MPILVCGLTTANGTAALGYRACDRRCLSPFDKPITEWTVPFDRHVKAIDDGFICSRLVTGYQQGEPTQQKPFIPEALHDL